MIFTKSTDRRPAGHLLAIVTILAAWAVCGSSVLQASLVPFQVDVNPANLSVFRTFNPDGVGGTTQPVEQFQFNLVRLSGNSSLFNGHAVLTTPGPTTPSDVGYVDIYYDGPAESYPAALSIVLQFTVFPSQGFTPVLDLEDANIAGTTLTSTIDAKFQPADPILFRHLFKVTPGLGSQPLKLGSPGYTVLAPNDWKFELSVIKQPLDAIVDLSQPVMRIEVQVLGAPEPGSLALAAMAGLGAVVLARRHRQQV